MYLFIHVGKAMSRRLCRPPWWQGLILDHRCVDVSAPKLQIRCYHLLLTLFCIYTFRFPSIDLRMMALSATNRCSCKESLATKPFIPFTRTLGNILHVFVAFICKNNKRMRYIVENDLCFSARCSAFLFLIR